MQPLTAAPPAPSEAQVAVMITAFRIGPILTDTILSALAQKEIRPVAVLLVIDGCPETATTGAIAARFAAAHPGLVQVLWLENGGVSRARNRGLDWLFDRYPGLDAVYCLDGDDLITTTALASSLTALRRAQARQPNRRYGWVIANKLNFGDDHTHIETPEGFRPANYLSANLSQPSCLYDADMFRAGLRWDERMTSGVEDWEFWLAAIEAGFEGVFNPADLLYYRRLMGNRSSVNRANDVYNIPYMRARHRDLFTAAAVLEDEEARLPRYAMGLPGAGPFRALTDPARPGRPLSEDDLRRALGGRLQRHAPTEYIYDPYAPDILCLINPALWHGLLEAGLLRGLLLTAEALFAEGSARIEGRLRHGGPGWHLETDAEVPAGGVPDFLLLRLSRVVPPRQPAPAQPAPVPETRQIRLTGPGLPTAPGPDPKATGALIDRLRADPAGTEGQVGQAQAQGGRLYISARRISRHRPLTEAALGTLSLLPLLPDPGVPRLAVVLPPTGLSDRVAGTLTALAHGLGPDGRLSLFAQGPTLETPAGITVENHVSLAPWLNAAAIPGGHEMGLARWHGMEQTRVAAIAGALAPFDAVLSFDLLRLAAAMLKLKSMGVDTWGHALPGDDPVGALNYAAAFRGMLCPDPGTAAAVAGLGYPVSRIARDAGPLLAALRART